MNEAIKKFLESKSDKKDCLKILSDIKSSKIIQLIDSNNII